MKKTKVMGSGDDDGGDIIMIYICWVRILLKLISPIFLFLNFLIWLLEKVLCDLHL